jgi:hypothetical protein
MADYVAVLDGGGSRGHGFAIDMDCAGFHGSFLTMSVYLCVHVVWFKRT